MTPMNTWSVPSCIQSFAQKQMVAKKAKGISDLEHQASQCAEARTQKCASSHEQGKEGNSAWIVVIPLLPDEKIV